ncbi:MAG TPA: nitroreductase family deazaflavin-dependent oxidoreductase [Anaerolineales bacterium]
MKDKPAEFRPPPPQLMRFLYRSGLGPVVGHLVLLLTTTGRKSGLPRTTPLQYEELDGAIYVGSARGTKANWFRNILANPCIRVRIGSREFEATAEPVTDPCRIADFLELRLRRHPRMVGAILKSVGVSPSPSRPELEAYAAQLAMVVIHPGDQR